MAGVNLRRNSFFEALLNTTNNYMPVPLPSTTKIENNATSFLHDQSYGMYEMGLFPDFTSYFNEVPGATGRKSVDFNSIATRRSVDFGSSRRSIDFGSGPRKSIDLGRRKSSFALFQPLTPSNFDPTFNFEASELENDSDKRQQLPPGQRRHSSITAYLLAYDMLNNQQQVDNNTLGNTLTNNSIPLPTLPSTATMPSIRPPALKGTDDENDSLGSDEDLSEPEIGEDGFSLATKKYKQPVSIQANNLTIGEWTLNHPGADEKELFQLEVKFLFGRRKIKYEMRMISTPKIVMVMEFTFSQISGVQIKPAEKTILFQLSKRPNFTIKERGRCAKVPDFTDGNASTFQTHCIYVSTPNFEEHMEHLLNCDRRLKQLERSNPLALMSIFSSNKSISYPAPPCDWDGENPAIFYCQDCKQNFCSVCDDVLHRNSNKRLHKRMVIEVVRPAKPKESKKRKKSESCRCGTGATKGTLGEPCTGNRCPCYSSGKGCSNCGCKNCSNPLKKAQKNEFPATLTQQQHMNQMTGQISAPL